MILHHRVRSNELLSALEEAGIEVAKEIVTEEVRESLTGFIGDPLTPSAKERLTQELDKSLDAVNERIAATGSNAFWTRYEADE